MNKSIYAFSAIIITAAVIAAVAFIGADAEAAFEAGDTTSGKVVMVIADYLSIDDLSQMSYVRKLAGKSSLALISNRQTGRASANKSKLIIGSGKRLELNVGTEGGSNGVDKLRTINSDSAYLNYIGYIGEIINRNNGSTCFLGNADTEEKNLSSMYIAMDGSGMVDAGETESILTEDELFPYDRRTDYKRLAELYKQYLPASSFTVIDTGDMERLENFSASMGEGEYSYYKAAVLKHIDGFIDELVGHGGFQTLIFISTYPSKSDSEENKKLTPVLVYQAGEEGILYSKNTRREGIILNTDLADYILSKLGYGSSAITELKSEKALYSLEKINSRIKRTSALRVPVLTSYAVMIMAVLILIFISVVFSTLWLSSIPGYMILAFPLVLLYLPTSYPVENPVGYTAIAAAASAILTFVLQIVLKDRVKVIFSICLLLSAGLSIDIFIGSPFIKQSVLGYDPVIGARFYGIGNEYAGIFVGCSLMVFGCIQEFSGGKLSKAPAILYFAFCTALLGLALFGANFGGALAGAAGYLLAYFLFYGIKFNKRNIFIGALIWVLTAAALLTVDSLGISSQSHMGGLVKDAGENGIRVITSAIKRKISMNLRLMRYTIWTKVLLIIIAIISYMFYKPVKILVTLFERFKYLKCSWISIAASAAAGFAVNDSGIVVAATAMIYAALTMLIMCINRRESKDGLQNTWKHRA